MHRPIAALGVFLIVGLFAGYVKGLLGTQKPTGRCQLAVSELDDKYGTNVPPGLYVPQCDSQGDYELMQMHASTGYRWCVDWEGTEISGTRVPPGRPDPVCRPYVAQTYGVCTAYGDIHYNTFDHKLFDYQGTCKHLLAGVCKPDASIKPFKVYLKGEHRNGNLQVSWIKYVEIVENGNTIRITRMPNGAMTVTVNGKTVRLNYYGRDFSIVLSPERDIVFSSRLSGLEVRFEHSGFSVRVRVPTKYRGRMCGMCGNFNGNPADDLPIRPGVPSVGAVSDQLGDGIYVQDDEDPQAVCDVPMPPTCNPAPELEQYCGIFTDQTSDFTSRFKCVGMPFFETMRTNCLFDACQSDTAVIKYYYMYANTEIELSFPFCSLCPPAESCACPSMEREQILLSGNCTHYCQCVMGAGCVKRCPIWPDPDVPICVPYSDVSPEWRAYCSGETTTKSVYYNP